MNYEPLFEAVIKGDIETAKGETGKALESGDDPQSILDDVLIAAMDVVGDKYAKGLFFVPQMLRSAKAMQGCVELLKPHFLGSAVVTKGTIVIGAVKGDLHDIGKNLVAMMLEGAGFTIVDLGVDIAPERFVSAVQEENADIVGMSALLSTTMSAMPETVQMLSEKGIRDKVKVMIGGAPVTRKYAADIGADSYAPDAGSAVIEAKKLLHIE